MARAVESHFAAAKDYRDGDLIYRSQIAAALVAVKAAGWDVAAAQDIVALGLADSSFLAVQLSRPAGRKFMRKIAAQPGGFARLDRLSTISGGQTLVKQLIRDKGGEVFMEYLATTDGGRRLGQQAAAAQRGVDLNKPTGRIYTVDDLIGELRRAWEKGGKATVDR